MDDVVIEVKNVSKKFSRNMKSLMKYGFYDISRNIVGMNVDSGKLRADEFWSVDDVSFELRKGEVIGLIGKNGSGKSTMLKMLNGIFMPDKGMIRIKGKLGALIDVGAGFHNLLTGRENIYVNGTIMGMKRKEINEKFDDIVKFAEIEDFLDSPTRNYSSGMYVRLGFSIAVHSDPEILLVDELLAVGDAGFQAKCLNKIGEIKRKGTSIILVTHNMHTLSAYADKAVLFNSGKMAYQGDVSKAIEQYRAFFNDPISGEIEKVVTSTDEFSVLNVEFLPSRDLNPGDTLNIRLDYESLVDMNNVEIQTIIYKGNEVYFKAINSMFDKKIDLKKGKGTLEIITHNIPINNFDPTLSISIWKQKREGVLFWWKDIKLSFKQAHLCMSDNFLDVSYKVN